MKNALLSIVVALCAAQVFAVYKLPFERGINIQGLESVNATSSSTVSSSTCANIRNRGFDHVRLPVNLRNHYDSKSKTLKSSMSNIDTYLANITNTGMYAILDFHGWNNLNTSDASQKETFTNIWRLVSERYRNWSDKLAFELINEPHTTEGGNLDSANLNEVQNEVIAIIRRTNPNRWIMAATADWNAPWTLSELELPADDNRLGVVCHIYSPMSFTHQGATWAGISADQVRWSRTDTSEKGTQDIIKNFLWIEEFHERTGMPVWLNEFGVIVKNNHVDMGDVADWVSYMVEKCKAYGVAWAWWEYHLSFGAWQNNSWVPAVITNLFPVAKSPEYTAYADSFVEGDYAKKMTVSFPGYAGSSPLANFPVLVRLSSAISGFSYSDFARNRGDDLRFTDASGNLIPHEIDTWKSNGVSTVWVRVPSLSSTTKIFAHYGCATPVRASTAKVWDDDYVGVWHLGESALPLKESSGASSDFSTQSGPSGIKYGQQGIVGGAVNFVATGKGRMVNAIDHDALDGFTQCTIEAWTYQTNHANFAILSKRYTSSENASYTLFDNGTKTQFSVYTNSTAKRAGLIASETNVWAHQAYTFNAGFVKGFLDGVQSGAGTQLAVTSIPSTTGYLHLGNYNRNGFWSADSHNFPGKIDEVRISKVERSADWIQATHDTVANANFATYSFGEEPPPEPPDPPEPLDPPQPSDSFAKAVKVAFTGYSGGSALADFPVLVRLSENIPGFSYDDFNQKSTGGDLRFFDAAGNQLAHEIDTWNPNGVSTVWVKVPTLNAVTTITAKYGCAEPPENDPKAVWSNGYVGVWHMDETTRKQSDSTSSGKTMEGHATYTANMAYGADGVVGKGVEQATPLDAEGKYRGGFQASDSSGLYNDTKTLTVEMWGCQREIVNDKYIVRDKTGSTLYSGRWTWSSGSATTKLNYTVALTNLAAGTGTEYKGVNYSVQTNDVLGSWRHYALVIDNETLHRIEAYHDGTSKKTQSILDADEALVAGSGTLAFGGTSNGGTQTYPGTIDELRVSRVARSADWVKATYETVMKPDFATYTMVGGGTLSGYAAWIAEKGIAGAPEDTATNGIPNVVRYAFDIDPVKGPSEIGTPIIQVVFDSAGNPSVAARDLAEGRSDIVFSVLATPDLTDWSQAVLVPMEKVAEDGLWKPVSSKKSGYDYPAQMFFKYTIDIN